MENNQTNERKNKKRRLIALLLLLAMSFSVVGMTYAKYVNTKEISNTVTVAKWAVKVNTKEVSSLTNTDLVFNEDTTYANLANVVTGKIAPGSRFYADFVIDPAGAQVAISYSFSLGTVTASTGNVPTGFKIAKVVKRTESDPAFSFDTSTEITESASSTGTYTGTIELKSGRVALTTNEKVTVRVYFVWENTTANDATDTTIGGVAPTLTVPVSIKLEQYIVSSGS